MLLHFIILLIFAHMLADYVFQWQSLVDRKTEGRIGAFVFHILSFFCLAMLLTIGWFGLIWLINIILLSALHATQDVLKIQLKKKRPQWSFQLELFDLLLHLFMIIILSIVFSPKLTDHELLEFTSGIYKEIFVVKMALYGSALVFVVRGGTSLVRALLNQIGKAPPKRSKMIGFTVQNNVETEDQFGENEYNVGKIIGNLERILLLVFVILGNYAAIGFVIAAKSIARFKDLEDHNFAEYYLVGTLTSSLIAIITGLSVLYISTLM